MVFESTTTHIQAVLRLLDHLVVSVVSSSTTALLLIGKSKAKSEDIPSMIVFANDLFVLTLILPFSFPDKTRGVMNEGGLFGERKGWHLPGFDTSSWASRSLSSGLPNDNAGVGFFVTTFDLRVPDGFDVLMSFNFDLTPAPYRALLFVNGWMMGKFVANLGYAAAVDV